MPPLMMNALPLLTAAELVEPACQAAEACTRCAKAFLRYTEYGGYCSDERIRALDAAHIVKP